MMKWTGKQITLESLPKKLKKMTGTRFASCLGLSPWATPFSAWCEITKTYEKPFEDTIYTIAGKTIEPLQADFVKDHLYIPKFIRPSDVWGEDYFKKTYGDFFPNEKLFGGMWDYLSVDEENRPNCVFEMKTTKRAEDWANGVPIYYQLQACLYAYLLKVDTVCVVVSFLKDSDYKDPSKFVPTTANTAWFVKSMSRDFPNFEKDYILPAVAWWEAHIKTGISPEYDEEADKDILKALRTDVIDASQSTESELIAEYESLLDQLAELEEKTKPIADRIDALKVALKDIAEQDKDNDTLSWEGSRYTITCRRQVKKTVDSAKLKKDGLYDQYAKTSVAYTITTKLNEEEGD